MCLVVVVELSSIKDKVCEVFYGYLMYVFHKFQDFSWGYLRFSSAYSDCL